MWGNGIGVGTGGGQRRRERDRTGGRRVRVGGHLVDRRRDRFGHRDGAGAPASGAVGIEPGGTDGCPKWSRGAFSSCGSRVSCIDALDEVVVKGTNATGFETPGSGRRGTPRPRQDCVVPHPWGSGRWTRRPPFRDRAREATRPPRKAAARVYRFLTGSDPSGPVLRDGPQSRTKCGPSGTPYLPREYLSSHPCGSVNVSVSPSRV